MDEQKLNRKLAEWAGWTDITIYPGLCKIVALRKENGLTYRIEVNWFTKSLDACFGWLVPKLEQTPVDLKLVWLALSPDYSCGLSNHKLTTRERDGEIDIYETAETPTLALCLAIEKLIDGERT